MKNIGVSTFISYTNGGQNECQTQGCGITNEQNVLNIIKDIIKT